MSLLDTLLVHRSPDVVLHFEVLGVLGRVDFHVGDLDDDGTRGTLLRKSGVHESAEQKGGGNQRWNREAADLHVISWTGGN
jgi:hypothetical protein